jgi:hypothetical protein
MFTLLAKLLAIGVVNGVTTQAEINLRTAADRRHPPFITAFKLPAVHPVWPEGTILIAGTNPGEATAATTTATSNIIGVLNRQVAENEASGNVLIHGSCPAEILKHITSDGPVDATAGQIAALRGVGVYV